MTRPDYEAAATLRGANFVGSPNQVAEKILFSLRADASCRAVAPRPMDTGFSALREDDDGAS
jgi:hypothetical protein